MTYDGCFSKIFEQTQMLEWAFPMFSKSLKGVARKCFFWGLLACSSFLSNQKLLVIYDSSQDVRDYQELPRTLRGLPAGDLIFFCL